MWPLKKNYKHMNQMFKNIGCCIAVFALFNQCTTGGKQEHTSTRLVVLTFKIEL